MQVRLDDVTAQALRDDLEMAQTTLRRELEREITAEGNQTVRQEQLHRYLKNIERGLEIISDAIEHSDQERKRTF